MSSEKSGNLVQCVQCGGEFKTKGLAAHMKYCSARPKFGNNHWLWNLFWNPCNAVWFMFLLVLWCNVVIILYNIGQGS